MANALYSEQRSLFMAQLAEETVLHLLEGRTCDYCDDGTLERGSYKGSDAVICDSCGAPAARIW